MAAFAALVVAGAFMVVSDEAEATHYWAGTLQWNLTPEAPDPLDLQQTIDAEDIAFFSGRMSWRWDSWVFDSLPECTVHTNEGTLRFTDGGSENYALILTRVDQNRNRGIGRIVRNDAPPSACNDADDDSTWHVPHSFTSENQGPGMPHDVWWQSCCRISYGTNGNYHVNNPDGSMKLISSVDLSEPNRSPIAELIPLRFCPVDALCEFKMKAEDPDDDRLSYRLAKVSEASYSGSFYQPGSSCGNCNPVLYDATIDYNTGVVRWQTDGAEIVDTCAKGEPGCPNTGRRNLYSMQIMVGDGTTDVPVDFMIELIEPPEELCPDGSIPPIDDWTGEYLYDQCEQIPDCDDPEMFDAPECQPPPPSPYEPQPDETPVPRDPWYAPELEQPVSKDPSLSAGRGQYSYEARDSVNMDIANLDSDGDGLVDRADACPNMAGAGATDLDGDGIGDGCDDDTDGDGLDNMADPCPLEASNSCVEDPATPEESTLGETASGDLASSKSATPAREGAQVNVAQEAAQKSPLGWITLAAVGGCLLVLLLAMAMRRRE